MPDVRNGTIGSAVLHGKPVVRFTVRASVELGARPASPVRSIVPPDAIIRISHFLFALAADVSAIVAGDVKYGYTRVSKEDETTSMQRAYSVSAQRTGEQTFLELITANIRTRSA